MRRGEVWWAALSGPAGRRPVVLLTRSSAIAARRFVTVAPVSRRIRGLEVEVMLGQEDGLPAVCAVNLDSLVSISTASVTRYITSLNAGKVQEVNAALRFALDL